MQAHAWYESIAMPALLRAARAPYIHSVRESLVGAGFDDVPRNGAFVLAGVAGDSASLGNLIEHLGVSKQAASQLIDTLVVRGYLDREADPADRRRLIVRLTDRGIAAAAAVRAGVEEVDAELARRLSWTDLATLRAGLGAMAGIGPTDADSTASSSGRAR